MEWNSRDDICTIISTAGEFCMNPHDVPFTTNNNYYIEDIEGKSRNIDCSKALRHLEPSPYEITYSPIIP